jgi:hypothetical protein
VTTTHSVQVGVRVLGHVVVEHNVDTLNVHAATKEIRSHKDPLLEVLELLVAAQSVRTHTPTNSSYTKLTRVC